MYDPLASDRLRLQEADHRARARAFTRRGGLPTEPTSGGRESRHGRTRTTRRFAAPRLAGGR